MFCFGAPCWRPRRLHPLATAMGSHCLEEQRLTLRVSQNTTGYFGVSHLPGRFKRYQARVKRGGKDVHLGSFVTAEEAALCVAQTPEGRAAAQAKRAGQSAPSLTSEEARQQAQAEGLTLRVAENKSGYCCVYHKAGSRPYQASVKRGGKDVHLGSFVTAEEAALCVARSAEEQAAAVSPPPPLTSEEARQQAQAEGLTLHVAENKSGYYGVGYRPGKPKPYQLRVRRGGKGVHLGSFVTAEEAALRLARFQAPLTKGK